MNTKKCIALCAILIAGWLIAPQGFTQDKQYKVGCIGFYNLENLFDTINDPNTNDEEFTPAGSSKWNTDKYFRKVRNLGEVISRIGDEYSKSGPAVMGLSEIENRQVVEDLIHSPFLEKTHYGIVHYDSPDKRGVDVAMIYNQDVFKVLSSRSVRLSIPGKTDWFTRDQLVVSGLFDGEPLYLIVNHWPSRSGGEERSAPLRDAAAALCRSQVDSIMKLDPKAKIIIMGDLNDNPTDESLMKYLKAKGEVKEVGDHDLYNPMYKMFKKEGIGSLAYRDSWSLFDQIILSGPLLGEDRSTYKFLKAKVFNNPDLTQKEGAFKGYPFRTFAGGVYMGGYSDHFPVYVYLVKEKK